MSDIRKGLQGAQGPRGEGDGDGGRGRRGHAGPTGPTGPGAGSGSGLTLSGRLDENVSGTIADFTPTGGGNVSRWYLDAILGTRFSGFAVTGGNIDGDVVFVYNTGASHSISLLNDDGVHSTPANRFLNPNGVDWVIDPGGMAMLVYDATAQRWRTGAFGTTTLPGATIEGNLALAFRADSGVLSGTINDLQESTVPGFDAAYALRVQTAGVIITGFLKAPVAGNNVAGSTFVIENLDSSSGNITLTNNGTSSAGNKIFTPTGASVNLAPGHSAILLYDTVWRIISIT